MQKVLASFSIIVVLLLSQLLILDNEKQIDEIHISVNFTEGRQLDDIDCSGYTLEDLFPYDFAQFNFVIEDDWATSSMAAVAYVNGSNSATVRENLDGLFDGAPGGNNSWISTDEREAVREIGPKCIVDMDTRLGIREGIPHRGGVDWNDFEFVEEGIALDEVDLVPDSHPEERNCQNLLASNDCTEVPVSVTDNLQIELFVANGENSNLRFDQLPNAGESNFTLALNLADIPNAEFVFTFPIIDGLRITDYAMEDDGIELTPGLDFDEPVEEFLPGGKLRIYQNVDFDEAISPVERNLFIDFTTTVPESNDIPQWTNDKPNDNSIIPLMTGTEYLTVTAEELSDWATDSNGWSLNCVFAETGWSSRQDENGNLLVTSPSGTTSSAATCSVRDTYAAVAEETLDLTFGQPFSTTAAINDGENIDFTIIPSGLVAEMTVSAHAHQENAFGSIISSMVSNQPITIALPMDGLKPGSIIVKGNASANNMMNFAYMLDFGLEKQNLPPTIILNKTANDNDAIWEASGLKFTLKGTVSDPDGETVSLSLTLCGSQALDFTKVGKNWEIDVSIATCVQQGITDYDVTISATDESGIISSLTILVKDLYAQEDNVQYDDWYDSDGDGFGDRSDDCVNVFGISILDRVGCIDQDGDGVSDLNDVFPLDPDESYDNDLDGVGDNADVFPNNANETLDTDNDGVGDNADAFPNNANETLDTDNDGVGDNADAFPNNANETLDTDNDGVGDNADAFPNDKNETIDSDNDGVGDNSDILPNDPDVQTLDDLKSNSEENNNQTYLIAISIIILAAVILYVNLRKNNHDKNNVISAHQNKVETDSTENNHQHFPNQLEQITIETQWTDESGYTWCEMSDGHTYWWDGNDWVLYEN